MAKENLDTRMKKAVLKIEKRLTDIYNAQVDLNLKLCHIIERMKDQSYYDY